MEQHHVGLSSHLVFPSNTGTYRTTDSLRKVYVAAKGYLKTDITINNQVLRRTYNTIMKDLTDMPTLHAMIGHSDPEMTKLYSGIDYQRKADAVAAFVAVLKQTA